MNVYPQPLTEIASRLLENDDFQTMITYRLNELSDEVLETVEPQAILEAHRERLDIKSFAEWIKHVSDHQQKAAH